MAKVLAGGVLIATSLQRWLPLPPPLPLDPPTDHAAPMPNANLAAPGVASPEGDTFALRIYPMQEFNTSDGFIPGSAYASPEERKPMQPPGFMVTVPLH